jgi:hypothetical protein
MNFIKTNEHLEKELENFKGEFEQNKFEIKKT